MNETGARGTLRRAVAKLTDEGPGPLAAATERYARNRLEQQVTRALRQRGGIPTARRYLRTRRRLQPTSITDADPFRLVAVDPQQIERCEDATPSKWGRVSDGDWDRTATSLEETTDFRSITAHFVDGVPWEETAEWHRYVDRLERGNEPKGCTSKRELRERLERTDELYARIENTGYRSQRDLWAAQPDEQRELFYKWGTTIDPRLDEVTVTIGRDGEVFHRGRGNHRLTIAKLLGLESIPVLVRTRHARWQAIREEVRAVDSVAELRGEVQDVLEHPDVQDVRPAKRARP